MAEEVGQAYVSLVPSARRFSALARRELRLALIGVDGIIPLKPDVDDRQAAQAGRKASLVAEAAAGPIRLKVSVLRADLIAAGHKIAGAVSSIATASLRTAGYGIAAGAASVAIVGLTSATAALVPALVGLSKQAIATTGLFVALPGAIGVAVAAVGTLKIGLVGLKEAFKAIVEGDAQKLDEALQRLAPNARAFAREVFAMRPAFKALQLDVQNRLFAGTSAAFRLLATSLLPIANRGFGDLATTINSRVLRAIAGLNSEANRLTLSSALGSANRAASNLLTTLRPVGQAILDLVGASTKLADRMSGGIAAAINRVAGRLSAFSKSDQFAEVFNSGVAAARQFIGLGRDVIGIFGGIGRAAGASNGFFSFFTRLNQLINSADVQRSLGGVFTELGRLGRAVEPAFVALAHALVPVARGIADVAEAFTPALVTFFDALGPALGALAPGLSALAPALAALAPALAPLAQILSGLVVAGAPGLVQLFAGMAAGLQPLAQIAPIVGKAIGDMLAALGPLAAVLGNTLALALGTLAPTLSNLVVAFTPLLQVVADAASAFAGPMLSAIGALVEAGAPLVAVLGQLFADGFAPLVPVLRQVGLIFATELVRAAPQIFEMLQRLVPVVAQLSQVFAAQLVRAFEALLPQLPSLISSGIQLAIAFANLGIALLPLLPSIVQLMSLVGRLAIDSGVLQQFLLLATLAVIGMTNSARAFGAVLNVVVAVVSTVIDAVYSLANGVLNAGGTVLSVVTGLGGRLLGAVSNFGSLLYEAGRSVVRGLIQGITSMVPSLGDTASKMAGKIRGFLPFSPAKEGPLSGAGAPFRSGQAIATNMAAGVTSQLPTVSSAASELAGKFGPGGAGAGGASAGSGSIVAGWERGATGDRVLDALRDLIGFRYGGDPNLALGGGS